MSELDKLEEYLIKKGYKYVRTDYNPFYCPWSRLDHHQIIVFDDAGERRWDAVCHTGSYGYEDGLLEIYGDIVWADIDGDSVAGWLTAQDVINRIEHGSEGARMDGEQDG